MCAPAAPVRHGHQAASCAVRLRRRRQQKVVRIIDAVPGQPVTHTAVPLSKGRPLAELRGSLDEVLAQREEAGDAYLRVRLDVERPEPGIAERVRDALPNAVDVQLDYDPEEAEGGVEALGQAHRHRGCHAATTKPRTAAEPRAELLALVRGSCSPRSTT